MERRMDYDSFQKHYLEAGWLGRYALVADCKVSDSSWSRKLRLRQWNSCPLRAKQAAAAMNRTTR